MNSLRYVGLDVHRDTISAAVLDEGGRIITQAVLATRATAILDFMQGIRGTVHVTFEEGTHSAWLYDLLVHRVAKLVVCNPRKNAADKGDTTTLDETLVEAGVTIAELAVRDVELHPTGESKVNVRGIEELVADKGYHSAAVMTRVKGHKVRSYIPEKKQKGRPPSSCHPNPR